MPRHKDLVGFKVEKITVIKRVENTLDGRAQWLYVCDCGNTGTASTSSIMSRNTKSCGCSRLKHNLSSSRQYHIWQGMKTRCDNPAAGNYDKYGAVGISYDHRWESFDEFWKDMQEGYSAIATLDRIDSSKGYSRENCRWVTYEQQNNNRRMAVVLTFNGTSRTITEWATELGINRRKIYRLHDRGLSAADIFAAITK